MMKAAGTSTIDAFCEFLAGDTIGIAIRMIGGLVVKAWQYIKTIGFIRLFKNILKAIKGYFVLFGKAFKNIFDAFSKASIFHPLDSLKRILNIVP